MEAQETGEQADMAADKGALREMANSNDPRRDLEELGREMNPFEYESTPDTWELGKMYFFVVSGLALLRVILFAALLLVAVALCALATLGIDPRKANERPLRWWRRLVLAPLPLLCRAALLVFGFFRIKVNGKPSPEAAFIVPNHCSLFDAIVMYWLVQPAPVAKAEVFKVPLLGRIMRAIQVIPVKRESKEARDWTKATIDRYARSRTTEGHGERFPPVLIFPQGTTTSNRVLTMFQRGAFLSGLPVQPVALDYSRSPLSLAYVVSRRKDYFHRRHLTQFYLSLEVTFLPVHVPTAAEKADATLFANNVRCSIANKLGAVMTEHSFEDAKLFQTALKLKESRHILQLLEAPEARDKVHLGNLQLREVKQIFGAGYTYGLQDVTAALRLFETLDTNGDGTLDYEEFCAALGLNSDMEQARIIFDFFDRDHSGSVNFREMVLSMALCSDGPSTEEKARFAFDLCDANHDGAVTEGELFGLLGGANVGWMTNEEVEAAVRSFISDAKARGADADGGAVRVSWPLFRELVEQHPQIVTSAISRFRSPSFPMGLDSLRERDKAANDEAKRGSEAKKKKKE